VECLTRIERGELLDASKIQEIGMRHRDRAMTFAQSATIRVRGSIREASQAYPSLSSCMNMKPLKAVRTVSRPETDSDPLSPSSA
jgi:hypothetical protein